MYSFIDCKSEMAKGANRIMDTESLEVDQKKLYDCIFFNRVLKLFYDINIHYLNT